MDEQLNIAELEEMIRVKEAHSSAVVLETIGDIPEAEVKPPDIVLFVCKLNPVTEDEDLHTIFSRFGTVISVDIIRDFKTGDNLCYSFIGPMMLCDPQELLMRRKLEEQTELQQVIELQTRRLRSLQLMDLRNHHHHHHLHGRAFHPNFPHGLPSPSSIPNDHAFQFEDAAIEDNTTSEGNNDVSPLTADQHNKQMRSGEVVENYTDDNLLPESLEHNLPENLFASPTKAAGENSVFSVGTKEATNVMPATSPLNNMSSINSCYFQIPRFSFGREAIEMNVS